GRRRRRPRPPMTAPSGATSAVRGFAAHRTPRAPARARAITREPRATASGDGVRGHRRSGGREAAEHRTGPRNLLYLDLDVVGVRVAPAIGDAHSRAV